jgi:hypothetical protein
MSSRTWVRIPPALLPLKPGTRLRLRLDEGMRFFWKNASLAARKSGFDSRRLH